MKKPLIGITANWEKEKDLKNYFRNALSMDYTKSIILAGGIPVIIPTIEDEEVLAELLENIDGLILSGGSDINPRCYGEDCKPKLGVLAPERDNHEILILKNYTKTKKPILGVCRGMQIINAYFGGTLYQDLSYSNKDLLMHSQALHPELEVHKVYIEKDSYLSSLFGDSVYTNSFHHQAVKDIAKGFKVTAKTSDGIIEGIEKENDFFCLGLQWHPEMMAGRGNENMLKVFNLFIEKAIKNMNK